jgi:hypothetical protein
MEDSIMSNELIRGFCLGVPRQNDLDTFKRLITDVLPSYNCNTLVLLIRYHYQFKSHPKIADAEALSAEQAGEIAELCKKNSIRIIPKMNLMGHQSEKERGTEQGLLRVHPEFDETPELESVRYCRSLCPRHPEVKGIVFDLVGEMIDAFQSDAIHVGLDEVFEIGTCPRCKGIHNSRIFADWVKDLHSYIVGQKKVEMLMWSDRFLDGNATGFGEWEASKNDTWQLIDEIPKDIIMCDWHYGERESYPSVHYFSSKGFRFVVCPWRELNATQAFLNYVRNNVTPQYYGFLQTSWCNSGAVARYLLNADSNVDDISKQVGESFKWIMNFSKGV